MVIDNSGSQPDEPGSLPSPKSERNLSPTPPKRTIYDQVRDSQSPSLQVSGGGSPEHGSGKKLRCTYKVPYPNCKDLIFERPCEWRRHMDKHERPFHCPHESCTDTRGFTYQGGLIRHEREVHNKFGGPREVLNCPIPYCKRHTGPGFTRRENLNEHLRRLHRTTSSALKENAAGKVSPQSKAEMEQSTAGSETSAPTRSSSLSNDRAQATTESSHPTITRPMLSKRKRAASLVDTRYISADPRSDTPSDHSAQDAIKRLRSINDEQAKEIEQLHHSVDLLRSMIHSLTAPRSSTWPSDQPLGYGQIMDRSRCESE